jgi:hypothetical protein
MGWLSILNPKVAKKVKSVLIKDKSGTITGVKPMSGKVPWYIGAGGKDPAKRAEIVKTWSKVKKMEKIEKHEKAIKEGKAGLKKMVDTGQAKEMKDYKGKSTGKHFRTGSR